MTQEQLLAWAKGECNRHVNGRCDTSRCVILGDQQKDPAGNWASTCEYNEVVKMIEKQNLEAPSPHFKKQLIERVDAFLQSIISQPEAPPTSLPKRAEIKVELELTIEESHVLAEAVAEFKSSCRAGREVKSSCRAGREVERYYLIEQIEINLGRAQDRYRLMRTEISK